MYFCLILIGLLLPAGVFAEEQQDYLLKVPASFLEDTNSEYQSMSNLDYFGLKQAEPTEKPPTYMDYVKEGWGYLEGGNYRDAEKSFEKAIDLNSTSRDAWYGKGLALENQKRYLSAVDAYKGALSFTKKPLESWEPNAGLGRTYLALQQSENAKEAFTLAISQYEKAGVDSPDELASIYEGLAEALENLGETDAAQDALNQAKGLAD